MNTLQSQDAATPPLKKSNIRLIPLTKGQFAIVDDADFEWLNQWKWHAEHNQGKYYAARRTSVREGRVARLSMHSSIMGCPKGIEIDHINGNSIDNRRINLRLATRAENGRNIGKIKSNTSGYKGVSWNKNAGKWRAFIVVNDKQIHLGYFTAKRKAAKAYDAAALKYHGEFARLNFPKISLDTNTSI